MLKVKHEQNGKFECINTEMFHWGVPVIWPHVSGMPVIY